MKKILAFLLIYCMILGSLTACGGVKEDLAVTEEIALKEALETMEPLELNWETKFSPHHKAITVFNRFINKIDGRTNGKVKITLYTGDTLVTSNAIYDALRRGFIDMGETNLDYTAKSGWEELNDVHLLFDYGITAPKPHNTLMKGNGFSPKMRFVAINKDVWNSMPAPVQKLFEEAANETFEELDHLWAKVPDLDYQATLDYVTGLTEKYNEEVK